MQFLESPVHTGPRRVGRTVGVACSHTSTEIGLIGLDLAARWSLAPSVEMRREYDVNLRHVSTARVVNKQLRCGSYKQKQQRDH